MRAGGLVVLLFALLPLKASAQAPAGVPRLSADPYPAHTVSFPGGVTGLPDIAYAGYVGFRPLLLDLYLPPAQATPSPLIVFIHGGSLKSANKRIAIGQTDLPATLASVAARGYVVASIDYRLRDEARFPAQVQDVKAAIIFLRANAVKYHIDPKRALLWGGSSGGQLAALAAMSCGKKEFAPKPSDAQPMPPDVAVAKNAHVSDCVQGAVSWYGDLQLSQEARDPDVAVFLGCKPCSPAHIAFADPMTYASATTPPLLVVQGTADKVTAPQARAMVRRLTELKAPVEVLYIPDVDHGFIGKTPEITRAANDAAVSRTIAFAAKLFAKAN